MHREERLDEEGVAEERQQRSGVGQRVEAIGRARCLASPVPRLQQRCRGRQEEIRQPHRCTQQGEDTPGRIRALRASPHCIGREGQEEKRDQEQWHVERKLFGRWQSRRQEMGVPVADQQDHLKEQ